MTPEANTNYTLKQHFHLIWRGIKVYSQFSIFPKPVILSSVLSSFFDAIVPFIALYFSARILNELAGAQDRDKLALLVLATVGVTLAALFVQKALLRWQNYCRSYNFKGFYKLYTNKALSLDFADIENPDIQYEYSQIRQHQHGMGFGLGRLLDPILAMIKGTMQIILSAALTVTLFTLKIPEASPYTWLNSRWAATIIVLVLMGPVVIAPYLDMLGGKIWTQAAHHNNKSNRFFNFYFFQMISGSNTAKDIRIYNQKQLIQKNTERDKGFDVSIWAQYTKYHSKFAVAGTAITYLCNGLIYLFIALKALGGAFGVGNIVLYAGAITQFGMGFSEVLSYMAALLNNNPFLDKVFQFLDTPNLMYQGSLTTEKRSDKKYEIEFRDVSFRYTASGEYALRHVSLKFNVGQRLAIVGQNGSGKTTFIKLLCRLYDPTEGVILLNGIDIKKYSYEEYIAIFSVVFQDFKLLPFTLGQNVAASVNYDRERVEKALVQSGFGERLSSLPKGLDTYLYKNFEEDGVEVSGGEAQKIALARALYKEAPFIILDEPTAALDPIAEFEVYSKMNEIIEDKTAVFISHRLSSCRFCNDIVVFQEGVLMQRGSHDDLIADTNGKYHELWYAQAQYYVDEAG